WESGGNGRAEAEGAFGAVSNFLRDASGANCGIRGSSISDRKAGPGRAFRDAGGRLERRGANRRTRPNDERLARYGCGTAAREGVIEGRQGRLKAPRIITIAP